MNCLNMGRKEKDFLKLPKKVRHKRFISPSLWSSVQSLDGRPSKRSSIELYPTETDISKSLGSVHYTEKRDSYIESRTNDSFKGHKSSEQLCFGPARKKKFRPAHINNFYASPSSSNDEQQELPTLTVPVRRRSIVKSAIFHLLGNVTSQSVGIILSGKEEKLNELTYRPIDKDEDVKRHFSRSSSSVSTLAYPSDTSMAPLQCHAETRSATCLNNLNLNYNETNPVQLRSHTEHTTRNTNQSDPAENELSYLRRSERRSIKVRISENSLQRKDSLNALSRDSNLDSAKNEQQMALSTTATTTSIAGSDKKEKKNKEVSSSRIKKFHRHFSQICKDENLINYFSCALVSDILLQGHLYITDKHFAFYSNVFGYITKLVIPTSSVTRVSKEKTAKIIPNAVGVATIDERHVFGSFISREAAFRLMCSVCPKMISAEIIRQPNQRADIEHFEEYSIEDDSSCSISGNESLPLLLDNNSANQTPESVVFKRSIAISNSNVMDIPNNAKTNTVASKITAVSPPASSGESSVKTPILIIAGSASSSTNSTPSSSPPTTVAQTLLNVNNNSATQRLQSKAQNLAKKCILKFPTELHIVYLGVLLTVVLAFFSIFLLYRIMEIESKASIYHTAMNFNGDAIDDENILAEALRWQKQFQQKSARETQQILDTNLEQIGKVRRSLETLSMLIRGHGVVSETANHEEND